MDRSLAFGNLLTRRKIISSASCEGGHGRRVVLLRSLFLECWVNLL